MIKIEFLLQNWKRGWWILAIFVAVAGCATQPPVTTPAADQQSYDLVFDTAVKAMKKMGNVQFSDRERGTISGFTPSGVTLEIEIIRETDRAPQLQVQALLPEGMADLGNINEPDRYLDIYHKLSQK